MENTDPKLKESRRLKLSNGVVLDPPSPRDWVLVDTINATIIHNSFIADLVKAGGTYMVLPMQTSKFSYETLKAAIEAGESSCREVALAPPKRYNFSNFT